MSDVKELLTSYAKGEYVGGTRCNIRLAKEGSLRVVAEFFDRTMFFELRAIVADSTGYKDWYLIADCTWDEEPSERFPDWAKEAISVFKDAMRNVMPHLS